MDFKRNIKEKLMIPKPTKGNGIRPIPEYSTGAPLPNLHADVRSMAESQISFDRDSVELMENQEVDPQSKFIVPNQRPMLAAGASESNWDTKEDITSPRLENLPQRTQKL